MALPADVRAAVCSHVDRDFRRHRFGRTGHVAPPADFTAVRLGRQGQARLGSCAAHRLRDSSRKAAARGLTWPSCARCDRDNPRNPSAPSAAPDRVDRDRRRTSCAACARADRPAGSRWVAKSRSAWQARQNSRSRGSARLGGVLVGRVAGRGAMAVLATDVAVLAAVLELELLRVTLAAHRDAGMAQRLRHLALDRGRLVRSRREQRLRQDHEAQQQDDRQDDGDDDAETRHLLR